MRRTVMIAAAALAITAAAAPATAATRTPPPPAGGYIWDDNGAGWPINLPGVGNQVHTASQGASYGIHYLGAVTTQYPFTNLLYDAEYSGDSYYQLQANGGADCLGNSGTSVIEDAGCNQQRYQLWVRVGNYLVNVTASDNYGGGTYGVVMTAAGTGGGQPVSDQVAKTGTYENQWQIP